MIVCLLGEPFCLTTGWAVGCQSWESDESQWVGTWVPRVRVKGELALAQRTQSKGQREALVATLARAPGPILRVKGADRKQMAAGKIDR